MIMLPTRTPSTVIADWLRRQRAGQWTPLEAADQIMRELRSAGYAIVLQADLQKIDQAIDEIPRQIADALCDAVKAVRRGDLG